MKIETMMSLRGPMLGVNFINFAKESVSWLLNTLPDRWSMEQTSLEGDLKQYRVVAVLVGS